MSLHSPVQSMQTKRVIIISFGHVIENLAHVTTACRSSSYINVPEWPNVYILYFSLIDLCL